MKYINQESLLAQVRTGISWHSPRVVPVSHRVALPRKVINHLGPLITDCGRAVVMSWANRTPLLHFGRTLVHVADAHCSHTLSSLEIRSC